MLRRLKILMVFACFSCRGQEEARVDMFDAAAESVVRVFEEITEPTTSFVPISRRDKRSVLSLLFTDSLLFAACSDKTIKM